jgi:excisionase family DNA binding protein
MPSTEDEFLTVAEVAQTLRLSQATIRKWLDDGRLPHVRIGRRVRIVRADLDRFMELGYSRRANPDADPRAADRFWNGEGGSADSADPLT